MQCSEEGIPGGLQSLLPQENTSGSTSTVFELASDELVLNHSWRDIAPPVHDTSALHSWSFTVVSNRGSWFHSLSTKMAAFLQPQEEMVH